MADPDDVVSLASALVRARSDGPPDHERPVIALLREVVSAAGAWCIEQETRLPGRSNLLVLPSDAGTADPGRFEHGLLFAGHADVVPPGDPAGWPGDPFDPWLDGAGRLHGRGTTDMKGALASFVTAFTRDLPALVQAQERGRLVGMLFTVDEEVSLAGAKAFCKSPWVRAFDTAVVPEPSGLLPVRGHKGVSFARFTVHGKAAHGSVPGRGVNAITVAMDLARDVIRRFDACKAGRAHPVLGSPTMNIGTIHGGEAANIVPASCTFTVDRRITWGETVDDVVASYRAAVDGFPVPDGASIDHVINNIEPPYLLDETDPFLRSIEAVHGKAHVMNGYTEAGVYHQAGVSAVILGPGTIDQAHVADEHVAVSDLVAAVDAYTAIMRRFIETGGGAGGA